MSVWDVVKGMNIGQRIESTLRSFFGVSEAGNQEIKRKLQRLKESSQT